MPISSNRRAVQRTNRFGREIRGLPKNVQKEAFEIAQQLASNIFSPKLKVKPLTGLRGIYRVVVVRDYRMVFSFDNENLYLLRIAHRREIYRNLEI